MCITLVASAEASAAHSVQDVRGMAIVGRRHVKSSSSGRAVATEESEGALRGHVSFPREVGSCADVAVCSDPGAVRLCGALFLASVIFRSFYVYMQSVLLHLVCFDPSQRGQGVSHTCCHGPRALALASPAPGRAERELIAVTIDLGPARRLEYRVLSITHVSWYRTVPIQPADRREEAMGDLR